MNFWIAHLFLFLRCRSGFNLRIIWYPDVKSFNLSFDFCKSKFVRSFVGHNYSSNAHFVANKTHSASRRSRGLLHSKCGVVDTSTATAQFGISCNADSHDNRTADPGDDNKTNSHNMDRNDVEGCAHRDTHDDGAHSHTRPRGRTDLSQPSSKLPFSLENAGKKPSSALESLAVDHNHSGHGVYTCTRATSALVSTLPAFCIGFCQTHFISPFIASVILRVALIVLFLCM